MELRRVAGGVGQFSNEINQRLRLIKLAIMDAPKVNLTTHNQIYQLEKRMEKISRELTGDATLARREFETPTAINSRIGDIQRALWSSTNTPSAAQKAGYAIAAKQMNGVISEIKAIKEELQQIETALEKADAPFTPGRAIEWKN